MHWCLFQTWEDSGVPFDESKTWFQVFFYPFIRGPLWMIPSFSLDLSKYLALRMKFISMPIAQGANLDITLDEGSFAPAQMTHCTPFTVDQLHNETRGHSDFPLCEEDLPMTGKGPPWGEKEANKHNKDPAF